MSAENLVWHEVEVQVPVDGTKTWDQNMARATRRLEEEVASRFGRTVFKVGSTRFIDMDESKLVIACDVRVFGGARVENE